VHEEVRRRRWRQKRKLTVNDNNKKNATTTEIEAPKKKLVLTSEDMESLEEGDLNEVTGGSAWPGTSGKKAY